VTVVSAPAGNGKTVLLRSWVSHARAAGSTAWVPVGRGERPPLRRARPQNLVQWNMHPMPGGHYAAYLEPDVLADDIRDFYRQYQ
jgi:hypothetical protein